MKRLLVTLTLMAAVERLGYADGDAVTISTFNPDAATAPAAGVEGNGVKVGEGTSIYPVVGLSTGFVSNVFYEDQNTNGSAILRLLAQVGAGSLSTARLTSTTASSTGGGVDTGSLQYRAELRLAYDFMLSGNDTVQETGGLGAGVTLRGLVNPRGPWSLGVDDNFTRYIRAANFETDADTNRDINSLRLNVIFHPQGRSLSGYFYYDNTLDVFERDSQEFADRMQHRFGIHPTWQWLPRTAVYLDVSQGIFTGLGGSSMKVTSYPLVARAGIASLITAKTSVSLNAGYTNGFYSAGPSYSSVLGGAQLNYRYSPLGQVAATYDLRFDDSVNANYYRDHIFRLFAQQMFVPFLVMVQPELHLRQYNGITVVSGPPTRDDVIFSVIAGLLYNFRNQLSVGLDYRFSAVETDYRYMDTGTVDDPSYSRHQLMLGMRWAL